MNIRVLEDQDHKTKSGFWRVAMISTGRSTRQFFSGRSTIAFQSLAAERRFSVAGVERPLHVSPARINDPSMGWGQVRGEVLFAGLTHFIIAQCNRCRTASWRQVKRPCPRANGQWFRKCSSVHFDLLHRLHLRSASVLPQSCRLSGVGSKLCIEFTMKENSP